LSLVFLKILTIFILFFGSFCRGDQTKLLGTRGRVDHVRELKRESQVVGTTRRTEGYFGIGSARTSRMLAIGQVCCRQIVKSNEQCCEPLRACCMQHSNISGPPPSPPCYNHDATILRPCCDMCCNIRSFPLLLDTNPNITCLQHRNSIYATLKFNICNIQHQGPSSSTQHPTYVYNIKIQHPQHQKIMFATSKLFRFNFETFTWTTRNM
jgi:hypothetical protein